MAVEADNPDEVAVVHDAGIDSIFPWLSKAASRREMAAAGEPWAKRYLASITDRCAEERRLIELFIEGGDRWVIMVRLQALGPECWPAALLETYRRSARRDARCECVIEAIRIADESRIARELGVLALRDRSHVVRWRAHQLLAYSLDQSVLPHLRQAYFRESRRELKESIAAAIKAIEERNHNLHLDRDETGRAGWSVNPWDCHDPAIQRGVLNYTLGKIREAWQVGI